jgi:hypothetical protein
VFLSPNNEQGERLMTLEDSVQTLRLNVFRRAEELGKVSAACCGAGVSWTLFQRWKWRYEHYSVDGLHPKRTKARPGRPPAVAAHVECSVIALALS